MTYFGQQDVVEVTVTSSKPMTQGALYVCLSVCLSPHFSPHLSL